MDGMNLALVQSRTYFGRDARERNLRKAELYVAQVSRRGGWKTKPGILRDWRCDAVLRANPELRVGSE